MTRKSGGELWRKMSQRSRSVVVNFGASFTSRAYSVMIPAVQRMCPVMETAVQGNSPVIQTTAPDVFPSEPHGV